MIGRILRSIPDLVERLGLPVLLIALICDTTIHAHERRFWFDELLSYWMIQLPDIASMWTAFHSGADPQPFIVFFPFRLSQTLFGRGEAAMRLPSLLAFAASVVLLYAYARPRIGRLCALAGASCLCLTYAYQYAYEARAYALLLGFTALGFVTWRRAIETRPRFWAVFGFALSMAGLVSTHYFAGLLLAVFGVGELWRSLATRRIDWPVALSTLAAPLALLPYVPALAAVRAGYQAYSWRTGKVKDFYEFYGEASDRAGIPACLALALAAGIWLWTRSEGRSAESAEPGFARYEIAALITLALSPTAYVLLAMYYTNAYAPRYAIASVFGLSCLLAALLQALLKRSRLGATTASLLMLAAFAGYRLASTALGIWLGAPRHGPAEHGAEIAAALPDDSLPVLVADPVSFLPAQFYAPAPVQRRMAYAFDIEAARRIRHIDSPENSLMALASIGRFTAVPYARFREEHQDFYVITFPGEYFTWLLAQLDQEGVPYEKVYGAPGVGVRLYHSANPLR
jgi:hypothetical protein